MKDNPGSRLTRADLRIVADIISGGSRVLDVGCGDGALLDYLVRVKGVDGRGIELSPEGVNACFSQGLSVIQGDAETDLKDYPSGGFDYVILSQTLPSLYDIKGVLEQLLRIGRCAIVTFSNFAHWRVRLRLLVNGRAPVTASLPHPWHATPNIRVCSIADFLSLCAETGIRVMRLVTIDAKGRAREVKLGPDGPGPLTRWRANWSSEEGVFLLGGRDQRGSGPADPSTR